jgi:sec-independent protein translocase protein TatA
MGNIGTGELLVVLAIVLLIFGGTKLPKLARSLGQAQKEFKEGVTEGASAESAEKPADEKTPGDA